MTFFASIMCLEARRQDARRMDLCCLKSRAPADQGCFCGLLGAGVPAERLSTRIMTWLGRQYATAAARVAVITLWLALLAAGIYGTSQMRVDADVNDFIPEGSYLRDWIRIAQTEFGTTGIPVELYWVNTAEVCMPIMHLSTCNDIACAAQARAADGRVCEDRCVCKDGFFVLQLHDERRR